MTGNLIICGKLDNRTDLGPLSTCSKAKTRLHARPTSSDNRTAATPVAVGDDGVWFDERAWDLEAFLSMAAAKGIRRVLVLTTKEYLQIVEHAATRMLRVDVFETSFPIFPDIKYNSLSSANYYSLSKCLRKLDQLSINSSRLSKVLAQRHLHAIVKKLRFKNGYDRCFFFAYKDGYQEVFKLKEERSDRIIIALDFNSMYIHCMRGEFCNPATIEYKDFSGSIIDPSKLYNGVYRVRLLAAKQSFLLENHPFRYRRLGRSYLFCLSLGDSIETLLNNNEIKYYRPFFQSIEIIEGVFSADTIEHPLLKKGIALYEQRMYHRRRGDRVKENLCKASMQHMHSATNQKIFSKKFFESMGRVREFLSANFAMNLEKISLEETADFLNSHKYFSLKRTARGYYLSFIDAGASSVVFSLSAQVVANARLKMLQTLERFLSHRSVELCYTNIDSIHLSIHRDEVDSFLDGNSDLISGQLGALKVEAIADKGYWFDVGRYWLKKDDQVVLFKNKGFNRVATPDLFVCRRRVCNRIETPTFSHVHTYVTKIENSFTYHKRLEHGANNESRFVRFRYDEIREPSIATLTEACEQLRSMKSKIELFQRISDKIEAGIEEE